MSGCHFGVCMAIRWAWTLDVVEASYSVNDLSRVFASFAKPGTYVASELYEPERAEYEEMLGGKQRELILASDFGSVGWGPLPHLTPEAMAYLLPRLMELAASEARDSAGELFMMRFINAISSGPSNWQYGLLNPDQRAAVASFLSQLAIVYGALIEQECWDDVLKQAIQRWHGV